MLRHAVKTSRGGLTPISLAVTRSFSSKPSLNCKSRVGGQILEQAQSVLPDVVKTVKPVKPEPNTAASDNAYRRNRLIWLVKHSLGKDTAADKKQSPHEREWDAERIVVQDDDGSARCVKSWEGPTVWPHLW